MPEQNNLQYNRLDKIADALNERYRSTLSEVIDELVQEDVIQIYNGTEDSDIDVNEKNAIYHVFKNPKKTGLLDRVEKYTGICLDDFKKLGKQEKSDMLCLVKYLYLVEYDFPLLRILSKPTLSKISINNKKGEYDHKRELEKIVQRIRSKTPEGYADKSDLCYDELVCEWMQIHSELFNMFSDACFSENQKAGRLRMADREEFFHQLSDKTGKELTAESIAKQMLDSIKKTAMENKKENKMSVKEEAEKLVGISSDPDEETVEYDSFVDTIKIYTEYVNTAVAELTWIYHNSFSADLNEEMNDLFREIGINKSALQKRMTELSVSMQALFELRHSFCVDELSDQEDYRVSNYPYIMEYGTVLDSFLENIRDIYTKFIHQLYPINNTSSTKENVYSRIKSVYDILLTSANSITLVVNHLINVTDEERIKRIIQKVKKETHSAEIVLDNIVSYLHQSISEFLNKIDRERISEIEYHDGVFGTFYSLFNKYHVKSAFSGTDTVLMNDSECRISADVQKFFSVNAENAVSFRTLDKMSKVLAGRTEKAEFEEFYFFTRIKMLIQAGLNVEITKADIRFSVKHLKTAIDWGMPDMRDKEYVNVIAAVTAMQELAYLYNTKLRYKYQYNRHDDEKTFSAIISKPETADEMVKIILANRLHYRFLVNIGVSNIIERLKNIRSMINDIVETLMMYHNIDDIQNLILSISESDISTTQFLDMINEAITGSVTIVDIEENPSLIRLLHEEEGLLKKLAVKIANQFDKYSKESQAFISAIKINSGTGIKILGDTENRQLIIAQLYTTYNNDELERLKYLGLEKCLNE